MRDDENIGSISKFYFGASAENRARATPSYIRTRYALAVITVPTIIQRSRLRLCECWSVVFLPRKWRDDMRNVIRLRRKLKMAKVLAT